MTTKEKVITILSDSNGEVTLRQKIADDPVPWINALIDVAKDSASFRQAITKAPGLFLKPANKNNGPLGNARKWPDGICLVCKEPGRMKIRDEGGKKIAEIFHPNTGNCCIQNEEIVRQGYTIAQYEQVLVNKQKVLIEKKKSTGSSPISVIEETEVCEPTVIGLSEMLAGGINRTVTM